MELNNKTEIRHLPANIREILARILESGWDKLMEAIPKELGENNEVDFYNHYSKYSSEQINQVQVHCFAEKINFPALVLFEEWGSSGKIRPTVGHLVKILSKLENYRAADYLCKILNEPCPERATDGPGAKVMFTSFVELPAQTDNIVTTYGDNQNNTDDNNKGYSNQNKVHLPERPKESCSDLIRFERSEMKKSHIDENSTTVQKGKTIPDPSTTTGGPVESMRPELSFLISDNSILSSKPNNETNQNVSIPKLPDLPFLGLSPIPNLSAFQTTTSYEEDSNHNITTNGYGEIENIPFSDIQLATDNFTEKRKLGLGGFSTVYLALNLRPAFERSAIKRLHTSYAKSSEHFFREIDLLKNVEHQNLIKLLGYSLHSDEMCFVYEYVEGGNLYEKLENCRLDNERLPWRDRIQIACGCSEGIKYLHSSEVNIIHRDIKSSNILLEGNQPKICDFGFVKNAKIDKTTIAVGTNPYMAPETVRGNVSIAVDIFAFGVVILELVSGFNVLDDSKPERIDLVTYFEMSLKQPDYHIVFTDKKAGDWKHINFTKTAAEELLDLARKCLAYKSDRLQILDVNLGLNKIYKDYCT